MNLIYTASAESLDFRRDPATARPELAAYFTAVRDQYLEPTAPETGTLLTDDYNPVESLSAPVFLAVRRALFKHRRDVLAYGL